jgi:hypothetical protein
VQCGRVVVYPSSFSLAVWFRIRQFPKKAEMPKYPDSKIPEMAEPAIRPNTAHEPPELEGQYPR